MFNKKMKQELAKYREAYFCEKEQKEKLEYSLKKQCAETDRILEFDKKMLEKIEELCKPKIDAFCLSLVESGIAVSSTAFNSRINILNKSYKSLEELLEAQAKELAYLKERDEENKQILFLSGKVEQLINKLNKKFKGEINVNK